VSGQKYYFRAGSDRERENWIERLQDASRITVTTIFCFTLSVASRKLYAWNQCKEYTVIYKKVSSDFCYSNCVVS